MNSILHWFLNDPYWLSIQGLVQNSTIIFWTAAISGYFVHKSCKAHGWCWRPGEHEVAGTAVKVCKHHHTVSEHNAVFAKHRVDDPEKLSHGESRPTVKVP